MSAGHLHRAGRQPFEQDLLGNAMLGISGKQLKNSAQRVNEGQAYAADTEYADANIRQALAEEKHQRRSRQRKQRDEPEMIEKVARWRHAVFFSSFMCSRYHFNKSIS